MSTTTESRVEYEARIDANQLRNAINGVAFSARKDTHARYAITGVQLRFSADMGLSVTATDGCRLCRLTLPQSFLGGIGDCPDMILPREAWQRIADIGSTARTVRIEWTELNVVFSWKQRNGEKTVIVPRDGGRWPDVDSILRGCRERTAECIFTLSADYSDPHDEADPVQFGSPGFERQKADISCRITDVSGTLPAIWLSWPLLREYLDTLPEHSTVRVQLGSDGDPIYCTTEHTQFVLMPRSK